MLFLLREEGGFEGKMIGVDYSAQGIDFCEKRLEELRRIDMERWKNLGFVEWDIMSANPEEEWRGGWDVVLDKGTFDAISLNEEKDAEGRRLCEGYRERVEALIKRGGLLLMTSCNWTEGELKEWFECQDLEAIGKVEYPIFRFGGQSGQSLSTVCFRKRS